MLTKVAMNVTALLWRHLNFKLKNARIQNQRFVKRDNFRANMPSVPMVVNALQ